MGMKKSPAGVIEVEWASASFGVHPTNSDKFHKNYLISRPDGVVQMRAPGKEVSL